MSAAARCSRAQRQGANVRAQRQGSRSTWHSARVKLEHPGAGSLHGRGVDRRSVDRRPVRGAAIQREPRTRRRGSRGVGERGDVAVDVAWRLLGPVREAIGGVAQERRGRGGIGRVEALEDRRRVVGGEALGGGAEGVEVATVVVAPGEAAHAGEGSNDDRSVGSNVDTNAAAEHAASVAERGNVASATIVPPAMPAVTADPLTLPRIEAPAPGARPVPSIGSSTAKRAVEGDGFVVRRPFPGVLSMADADPFLLLDHMGAVDYAPGEAKGTSWHPHRGFETVTYLVDGQMEHRTPPAAAGSSPTAPPSG